MKPLSAGEFWNVCRAVADPSLLSGMSASDISAKLSIPLADGERYAALLGAGTAFAFERERLEEEGVHLISALDDAFPERLRERLRDACPPFLLVAGPIDFLDLDAIGVVGSRDASPAALEIAGSVAAVASSNRMAIVSGLARGIDQAAMASALDAGVPVVGVPTEGIRVAARSPEIRRRAHASELCVASPYAPGMRFVARRVQASTRSRASPMTRPTCWRVGKPEPASDARTTGSSWNRARIGCGLSR